jgi:hypothetical protein
MTLPSVRSYPIICLEGPSAVGKTSLAAGLAKELGAAVVPELDATGAPPVAESAEWFVDRHAAQWRAARALAESAPLAVIDCDPFKGLWYNWMHAREGWQGVEVVAPLYRARLEEGSIDLPDVYFFLDATGEHLRHRRAADATRRRSGFEKHLQRRHAQRDYFEALRGMDPSRVVFLDTSDRDGLVAAVMRTLDGPTPHCVTSLSLLDAATNWIVSRSLVQDRDDGA